MVVVVAGVVVDVLELDVEVLVDVVVGAVVDDVEVDVFVGPIVEVVV